MISIIIPTLNEARALPATLDCVFTQQGEFEVIVVDGGSCDGTLNCVAAYPQIKSITSEPGRARQLNAGAAQAKGEWLLFLHADTLLSFDALSSITQQQVAAGGFKHQFSGDKWSLAMVSWLHNMRCRCTNVFYGDQAMFIRHELFLELGGFPDVEHLEDLLFSEQIRQHVKPVLLNKTVVSDSRKFEKKGVWLSLYRVILIQLCHELGLPVPVKKFFAPVR